MKIRAKIQNNGKTATGIEVSPKVVEGLGSSKRPPVRVTINGYTYRTSIGSMGGVFMLPVTAEVRTNAGVAAGDMVNIDIELDTEPREVTIPPDFKQALDRDVKARRFFDGLSYSNKRRYVIPIEEAKTAETRQRRIAKAVSTLREGKA
jgi:Bacteriocin-protection, YdeI or OmpD-Associated/Domain of unknown function (DUF1905)